MDWGHVMRGLGTCDGVDWGHVMRGLGTCDAWTGDM